MTWMSGQAAVISRGRLGAVHDRHQDVHEHHVGADEAALVQGFRAVRRLGHDLDVVAGGQQDLEALSDHLVVVDDQHPDVASLAHAPILSSGRSSEAGCSHAAWMVVPAPGELSTVSVPATRSSRSFMMCRPMWPLGTAAGIEASAVVLHDEGRAAVDGEHARGDLGGPRVLGDVAERLLRHPVEGDLDVVGELHALIEMYLDLSLDLTLERIAEALEQRVQRRRRQGGRDGARTAACASPPSPRAPAAADAPGCGCRPRGRAPTRRAAPPRSAWRCRCSASPRRAGRGRAPGAPPRPPASSPCGAGGRSR